MESREPMKNSINECHVNTRSEIYRIEPFHKNFLKYESYMFKDGISENSKYMKGNYWKWGDNDVIFEKWMQMLARCLKFLNVERKVS